MKGLRVALVNPYVGDAHLGIEREMVELANHLQKDGAKAVILTMDSKLNKQGPPRPLALDGAVEIRRLPVRFEENLHRVQSFPLFMNGLSRALAAVDCAVLFNGWWPLTLLTSRILRSKRSYPILYRTYYHPPRGRSQLVNRGRECLAGTVLRRMDRLVVATEQEGEYVSGLSRRGDEVRVVRPGTAIPTPSDGSARRDVRTRLGIPDEAIVLIQLGRPGEFKGTDVAITVVRDLRARGVAAFLLVVGEIADAPWLSGCIAEARVEPWVRVTGLVDEECKSVLLDASDIIVVLSIFEAFSFVVLEGIAHKCRPIIYDDFPSSAYLMGLGATLVNRKAGTTGVVEAVILPSPPQVRPDLLRTWEVFGAEMENVICEAVREYRKDMNW